MEFGAQWVQDWSADITHVIVDHGLDYRDVLRTLNIPELPVMLIHSTEELVLTLPDTDPPCERNLSGGLHQLPLTSGSQAEIILVAKCRSAACHS